MTQAQSVTPLRQRMLDDMKLRNMAKGTRRTYVRSVADFSAFHGRSPDEAALGGRARLPAAPGRPRPQGQHHLPDHECFALPLHRHTRPARGRGPHPAAAQGRSAARHPLPWRRSPACWPPSVDLWMRTLLTTVYAAGLRVSEVVGLEVTDIDSARMTIHVREGKGGRDRYVMLSPQLLAILRAHWRRTRSATSGVVVIGCVLWTGGRSLRPSRPCVWDLRIPLVEAGPVHAHPSAGRRHAAQRLARLQHRQPLPRRFSAGSLATILNLRLMRHHRPSFRQHGASPPCQTRRLVVHALGRPLFGVTSWHHI